MRHFFRALLLGLALMLNSCSSGGGSGSTESPPPIKTTNNKIIIVDQTGKEWDVTSAVKRFGFEASGFEFGEGPFAILPINSPKLLCPSDTQYPSNNQSFLVIGATSDVGPRAYPIFVMKINEIVNEFFGDAAVAVAY